MHETFSDSIAKATRQHLFAVMFKVFKWFEIAALYKIFRCALFNRQACPYFRHQ